MSTTKMRDDSKSTGKTPPAPAENDRACEKCGRYDAIEMGEHFLCGDCIAQAGCACAESETED